MKYYDVKLCPGATCSDHSDGFRHAFTTTFSDSLFVQCWPHIAGKHQKGEYVKKTFAHFDKVTRHLYAIHMAHTAGMRDLLTTEIGQLWDRWGNQMNTFWNSYCIPPWNNWSFGLLTCMLATPNQNCQESWHNELSRSRIPNMFRGSTEYVFAETLPQLVQMDALLLPTELNFDVPAIPKKMMEKAIWYIDHQDTHIWASRMGDGTVGFYILSKDNPAGVPCICITICDDTHVRYALIHMYDTL